jgi:hypothetical protein
MTMMIFLPLSKAVLDARGILRHYKGKGMWREKMATTPQTTRVDSATVPAWAHLLMLVAAFGIAFSRRPDTLLNAQFSAEGGTVFFADAYNHGLASLFMATPHAGYLQIFERLIALFASLFPLSTAPLITNLLSLAIIIVPVTILLSSRFDFLGPVSLRRLFAFGYLALPSTVEVFANLAAISVYMTLSACLVIGARPDDRLRWNVFDVVVLVLFSLTGPAVTLMFPLVALLWWVRRQRRLFGRMLALVPGAIAQATVILLTFQNMRTSATAPLGVTPALFAEILSRQMFLAPLLGMRAMPPRETNAYVVFSVCVVLLGAAAMAYCLLKAPIELKVFIGFSVVLVAATLGFPLCSLTIPQWRVMTLPAACNRYWMIPMLSFLASLAWIVWTQQGRLRYAALIVLFMMPVGILRDWRHPAFVDQHFAEHAREFARAPQGAHMVFAIDPPGWYMELVKK